MGTLFLPPWDRFRYNGRMDPSSENAAPTLPFVAPAFLWNPHWDIRALGRDLCVLSYLVARVEGPRDGVNGRADGVASR